jgi:hypothetical protein
MLTGGGPLEPRTRGPGSDALPTTPAFVAAAAAQPSPSASPSSPPRSSARTVYDDPAKIVGGKAYIIASGQAEIVNHEFANMAVGDGNGAGIRLEGGKLIVRDSWFHDGQQGILSGNLGTEELEITGSRFERLGHGGQAHGVYCGINKNVVVRDSAFLSGQGEGHEFKCRADAQLLERVIFASLMGEDSRNLDVEQGHVTIKRAVFQHGAQSSNEDFVLVGLVKTGSVVIEDAIFVNDSGRPAILVRAFKGSPVTLRNVVVIGAIHPITGMIFQPGGGPAPVLENVTRYATRAEARAAGIAIPADYDGTEASLPWPAEWGKRPGELAGLPTGTPEIAFTGPAALPAGMSAKLDWTVRNASGCTASGAWTGPQKLAGSLMTDPLYANASFTLTCSSRNGRASKTISTAVAQNPPSSRVVNLANLPKGRWTEIPDSKLSSVYPVNSPTPFKGSPMVMLAWNGGAFDAEANHLYVWGGGHEDYGGNEVYRFNVEAFRWERLIDPSPVKEWIAAGTIRQAYAVMADGPTALHTYSDLVWVPSTKRFIIGGAFTYRAAGGPTSFWQFDPAARKWERLPAPIPGAMPAYLPNGLIAKFGDEISMYDPVAHKVVKRFPNAFYTVTGFFSPAGYGDGWHLQVGRQWHNIGLTDLRDPGAPKQRGFTLTPEAFAALGSHGRTYPLIPTSGQAPVPPKEGMGLFGVAWSAVAKKFALWKGAREVWTFDPVTLTFERLPNLDGPTPIPHNPPTQGVYGRWAYMPKFDAFVGVDNPSGNVWLYRLP